MYEPFEALASLDQNKAAVLVGLYVAVICVFIYWIRAFMIARQQQTYVVPFIGISVFFWHDLTFVLMYDKWFNVYDHWWLKLWWFALVPSLAFEAIFIYHVIRYGRQDFFSFLSQRTFTYLVLLATLGVGGFWYLIKMSLGDELFFITFAITAVWSVPLHTGLMGIRKSRRGQSYAMELATVPMILGLSYAFAQVSDFFVSPVYLIFVAVVISWALVNVALIRRLPDYPIGQSALEERVATATARG